MPVTFAEQVSPELSTNFVTKKPKDTALKQQRVPAWQPIYSVGFVVPSFFLIGIAFLPIGIGMLSMSNTIREKFIPYTDCKNKDGQFCKDIIMNQNAVDRDCYCNITFDIDTEWKGDVFIFYSLTNFYQNHRRYLRSWNKHQLLGEVDPEEWGIDKDGTDDCDPYKICDDAESCCNGAKGQGRCDYKLPNETFYFPCGAVANSLFSDVISLKYDNTNVALIRTGIAWETDKKLKFKNPTECALAGNNTQDCLKNKFKKFAKPKDWKKNLWELDVVNPENNGLQNEDLILWMRAAAFSSFKKLYRKINHTDSQNLALSSGFKTGLPQGAYSLIIEYNFEVASFNGTKGIVLSTLTLLGNRTYFLAYGYIIVGSICLALGFIFWILHIKYGKDLRNLIYIDKTTLYYEK